jgi:hypothetical protein
MHTLRIAGVTAFIVTSLVSGCQAVDDTPTPAATPQPEATDVVETTPDFVPERIEGGTARDNQPHVDWVIETARAEARTRVLGLDVVSRLEASGYPRLVMELTPDFSLIELPADSTALAIRFEGECVVAQWGDDWYASAVMPVVVGDKCLLGETVSLD